MERKLSKLELFALDVLLNSYHVDLYTAREFIDMGKTEVANSFIEKHKRLCVSFLDAINSKEGVYVTTTGETFRVTVDGVIKE